MLATSMKEKTVAGYLKNDRNKVTNFGDEERKAQFRKRQRDTFYALLKEGEIGPGEYDAEPIGPKTHSPDFSRTIGRTESPDKGVGPAQYSPKREVTLYTSPSWTIGTRPDEKARLIDNTDFYPTKEFGASAPTFKIQPEKKVSPPRPTAGPGAYDWEKGVQASKPKVKSVIIQPESALINPPEIMTSFYDRGGPGTYDTQKPFGAGGRAARIDPPTQEKKLNPSPGPGNYDATRADGLTKSRSAATIFYPSSQPRTPQRKSQSPVGPGSYEPQSKFGSGARTFQIGGKRRERTPEGVGPGQYDPTRAESQTLTKSPSVKFAPAKGDTRPSLA